MVTIIFILGLAFLLSGILAMANITQVGLTYAGMIRLHTLPYLNTLPSSWVYIGLGLLLVVISFALSKK